MGEKNQSHKSHVIDVSKNKFLLSVFMQHNIKKVRNNVEKSSTHGGKRVLTKGGKNIFWSHWKEAYLWDQKSNSCPLHERLKEEHFELTPSSRMRNELAEDVLDKRMLFLMNVIVGMSADMYVYMQYIWMLSTTVARHYKMLNALQQ